ncbi:MAG: isoleucine--tRNA ligase [Lachnospiraceae bacterium]|jgi:isoleucyl-tRNA synthetase|nr:isoleucine--tRNA ligase [Lachnospiraceae bacterium]
MSEEKKDYGATLNLPKTDFPMRASLPENEPKVQENVFDKGLYKKILKKNEGNEPYVLHDGPPYANGEIHIGHALNKILKDTIVRYKNLRGYYTPYIPGFDTHGLPTEKRAIQMLGINRDEVSVSQFRNTCRDFALGFVEKQTEGFKRLGVLGDWEDPYITLEPEFESRQIGVFGEMYEKGYIYKGLKPVYWCTDCETALAEAEIEYADSKTTSIYVKFAVKNSKGLFNENNTYFVIWTTTPWTLPGNVAITIGPDFKYSLVNVGAENYVIASELVENVMKEAKIENYKIEKTFEGSELEGVLCKHPFIERDSKVVLGSDDTILVELGTGTGAVHTAPGYGKEDYLCGIKNDLEIVVCVDGKGFQTEGAGPFAGLRYDKSNEKIIEWLEENNMLLHKEEINHSYPHCWRCKNPIIFRATDQWFASVEGFREKTLEEIKKVKWIPGWGEERISSMIKDRADWCISRQRTWGVPIPIFYCEDCKKEYITHESIEKVQKIFREKGSNAWYDMSVEELLPEGAKCKCGHTHFTKETDIMDVWFDSGSSHVAVLEERGLPPANMYLEGNDQYRGWFQSSILTAVATKGIAPYKEVLTHGFVIDGNGKKMSKSMGNSISPQEIIKEYGADILRLWVLSSDYKNEISLSKDILKQITEVYRKIRNTCRYILGNISDFDVNSPVEYEKMPEIDKWALLKLNSLIESVTKDFDEYEFHAVYHSINDFCVVDMSNFYLDIIKDRLYTSKPNSIERRSAQTVMYEILCALVKILAPLTCFTAEEIWSFMPHKTNETFESVMLAKWPETNVKYQNKEIQEKWSKIVSLKEEVSKKLEIARAEKTIGHSLNAKVVIYLADEEYEFLKPMKKELESVFIVSDLEIVKGEKDDKIEVQIAEGEKCERCWKYSVTVGENKENPTICKRCNENLIADHN